MQTSKQAEKLFCEQGTLKEKLISSCFNETCHLEEEGEPASYMENVRSQRRVYCNMISS
jgi:Ca2+-dependent lipid-binding protein